MHKLLSQSILGTTLRYVMASFMSRTSLTLHPQYRWLDETPVSRVIQRLTVDIDSVDGVLTVVNKVT